MKGFWKIDKDLNPQIPKNQKPKTILLKIIRIILPLENSPDLRCFSFYIPRPSPHPSRACEAPDGSCDPCLHYHQTWPAKTKLASLVYRRIYIADVDAKNSREQKQRFHILVEQYPGSREGNSDEGET